LGTPRSSHPSAEPALRLRLTGMSRSGVGASAYYILSFRCLSFGCGLNGRRLRARIMANRGWERSGSDVGGCRRPSPARRPQKRGRGEVGPIRTRRRSVIRARDGRFAFGRQKISSGDPFSVPLARHSDRNCSFII